MESKKWYQSVTIWGAVISTLGKAGAAFGYEMADADVQALAVGIPAVVSFVGDFIAIVGRLRASKTIGAPTK